MEKLIPTIKETDMPEHKRICFLFFISVLFFSSFQARSFAIGNDKINLSGYYKSYFTLIQPPSFNGNPAISDNLEGLVINTLRLQSVWTPVNRLSIETAYALNPNAGSDMQSEGLSAFPFPNPFRYRAYDTRGRLYPSPGDTVKTFYLNNNIDRFIITYRLNFADIVFGRQPIAFGSAKVINPTDVLAPFTFNELDKEERIGIDALRIKFPVSTMGELDIGYVFGDEFKFSNSALFIRFKSYVLKTDVTPITIIFRNNLLLGINISRSVGGATVWLEGSEVLANLFKDYNSDENYFRLSAGTDYQLLPSLYGFIEYHFSQAGKIDAGNYDLLITQTAYREGGVYLLGQHYIIPGIFLEISPLWGLSAQTIINANDPSFFLLTKAQYNIAENIYIDAGVYLSMGKKSEINLNPDLEINAKSEFGIYPNTFFTSLRFYF